MKATGGGAVLAAMTGYAGRVTRQTQGGSVEGPIRIGVLGPADSPVGQSIFNSVTLAADEINGEGGIGGAQVQVVTKDTKQDPSTGRAAYQELTTGENVDLTAGIFTSEVLLTILPLMAQQQTIHLTSGAATPEAPQQVAASYDQFKYFFRVGPVNSHYLGVNMVDFAKAEFGDMGFSSVAVMAEDFKWTEPISAALQGDLEDTGVDVPYNERIAGDTQDFTPIYDEIQSQDVDAVYTVLAHIGTSSLVQWAKQQRPFQYGGIHVPAQYPNFWELTTGATAYVFAQNTATPQVGPTDQSVPYANAYNDQFGGYPIYTGYSAYDSVYIYKNAVEQAGSKNADDLVEPLEGTSYTGVSGTVEFYGRDSDYPHDVKYGSDLAFPLWYQWQPAGDGGTPAVFYPDSLADGQYEPAPWTQ